MGGVAGWISQTDVYREYMKADPQRDTRIHYPAQMPPKFAETRQQVFDRVSRDIIDPVDDSYPPDLTADEEEAAIEAHRATQTLKDEADRIPRIKSLGLFDERGDLVGRVPLNDGTAVRIHRHDNPQFQCQEFEVDIPPIRYRSRVANEMLARARLSAGQLFREIFR